MTSTASADEAPVEQLVLIDRVPIGAVTAALLTLNRPAARNPIDKVTIRLLKNILRELITEDEVAAVIITGAGEAFSAGGDLKGYMSLYQDNEAFRTFMSDFDEVCRILETAPLPTIAMINGTCVAGGLELSLACDFITIADDARVGDGHLRFAQLPGAGGSQRLVRAIGVQRAKHWLYTARLFPAAEAVAAGLAVFSCPAHDLLDRTLTLAAEITELTPQGWRTMKRLVDVAQQNHLEDGLKIEGSTVFEYATSSYDATEGLKAFAERRPPHYLGRSARHRGGPPQTGATGSTDVSAESQGGAATVKWDEMQYAEAGAVTLGVVHREFTLQALEPYRGSPGVQDIIDRIESEGFYDRGVSIYVFQAGTKRDYLRFDCFEAEPHYHYHHLHALRDAGVAIEMGHQQIGGHADSVTMNRNWHQVPFDAAANGDMRAWALERLRTRLPEMLTEAGEPDLARQVDMDAVRTALESAETLVYAHPESQ
jgi:enoyl-CoA hydratase/carnithine racemase